MKTTRFFNAALFAIMGAILAACSIDGIANDGTFATERLNKGYTNMGGGATV